MARLYESTQETVTAFRPDMAVLGRFGKLCPVCDTSVQEIANVSNETNDCPRCQTGEKVIADRTLSRRLREPKTIEELESRQSEQDAHSSPSDGR